MIFFLSAEYQNEVRDGLHYASNQVRKRIIPKLGSDYGLDVERWTHIAILRPKIPPGWGEVTKYHRDARVAEFRLIIDYKKFKGASAEEQVQMLVQSIIRSTNLFPVLNVKLFDIDRFRRDIVDAAVAGALIAPRSSFP